MTKTKSDLAMEYIAAADACERAGVHIDFDIHLHSRAMLAALKGCHRLILRDYSDPRAAALEGHPIASDARVVWAATCEAIAAAEAAGIKTEE